MAKSLPNAVVMLYCAAWLLVNKVEKEGRVAPATPGPVLLNSAKNTSSVLGSPGSQIDQTLLSSYAKDLSNERQDSHQGNSYLWANVCVLEDNPGVIRSNQISAFVRLERFRRTWRNLTRKLSVVSLNLLYKRGAYLPKGVQEIPPQ